MTFSNNNINPEAIALSIASEFTATKEDIETSGRGLSRLCGVSQTAIVKYTITNNLNTKTVIKQLECMQRAALNLNTYRNNALTRY